MKLNIAKKIIIKWKEFQLTNKQIIFLANYIENNFHARKALLLTKGYNPKNNAVADVMANRLLNNSKIKEAYNFWKKEFLDEIKNKLEPKLIDILYKRATYDISIFCNKNGTYKKYDEIPKEWRCCIDGTEKKYYGKDANVCVIINKLADRDKAMDKLDKYIQMTKEKESDNNTLTNEVMKSLMDKLEGK